MITLRHEPPRVVGDTRTLDHTQRATVTYPTLDGPFQRPGVGQRTLTLWRQWTRTTPTGIEVWAQPASASAAAQRLVGTTHDPTLATHPEEGLRLSPKEFLRALKQLRTVEHRSALEVREESRLGSQS